MLGCLGPSFQGGEQATEPVSDLRDDGFLESHYVKCN